MSFLNSEIIPSRAAFAGSNCSRVCEGYDLVFVDIYDPQDPSEPLCNVSQCYTFSLIASSIWLCISILSIYLMRQSQRTSTMDHLKVFQIGLIIVPILNIVRNLINLIDPINNIGGYVLYSLIYIFLQADIAYRFLDLLVIKIYTDIISRLFNRYINRIVYGYFYIATGIIVIVSLIIFAVNISVGINQGATNIVFISFLISSYTLDVLSLINILLVIIYLIYILKALYHFKNLVESSQRRYNNVRNMSIGLFIFYTIALIVVIVGRGTIELIFPSFHDRLIGMSNNLLIAVIHQLSLLLIVAPRAKEGNHSSTNTDKNLNQEMEEQDV